MGQCHPRVRTAGSRRRDTWAGRGESGWRGTDSAWSSVDQPAGGDLGSALGRADDRGASVGSPSAPPRGATGGDDRPWCGGDRSRGDGRPGRAVPHRRRRDQCRPRRRGRRTAIGRSRPPVGRRASSLSRIHRLARVAARGSAEGLAGASELWGRGERFGLLPGRDERAVWYASANVPEGGRGARGERDELLGRFGRWPDPIPAVLDATPPEAIVRNDVYDRSVTRRWVSGRIALVGDAAHPMTPDLGQGACQAIVDAWVLADGVRRTDRLETALRGVPATAVASCRDRHGTCPQSRARRPVAASCRVSGP